MGSIFMGKKDFTIEEKIKAIELHIHDGMGYGAIADRYGVPITTLRHWIVSGDNFSGIELGFFLPYMVNNHLMGKYLTLVAY